MQILNPNLDLNAFFESLRSKQNSVLFLDYDGTLAPFNIDPKLATPYPGVITSLKTLINETNTRVIIISGRGINDLIPLLKLEPLPELWGAHGGERFTKEKGFYRAKLNDTQIDGLKQGLDRAAKLWDQNRIEKKPTSIALHWRGEEEQTIEALDRNIRTAWEPIAKDYDLETHRFDGGVELRPKGMNKGHAIATVLNEISPFSNCVMAYLGDDATDEEAFAKLGSKGLKVLVRKELRETSADLWLTPPQELLNFLDQWKEAAKIATHLDRKA